MILVLAIVLGLAASWVRHRRQTWDQIAAISLQWAPLALLAVLLQVPLLRAPAGPIEELRVEQALFLLSHVLLLALVWRNRRQVSILILGLGVLCNLAAVAANRGFMPISPETLVQINPGSTLAQWPSGMHYGYSKDIILLQGQTRLRVLSDMLILPPPFPWPTAFSLGDLFLAAGVLTLLQGPGKLSKPARAGVADS
jgi:hypothetical protein